MVDAMEDGYMDSDGEGNMFKVKLDNISRNTLLHLIDSDKVSRHMALKEEGKVVISSKKMFRDGFGKRVSPEVIKRRTSAGYGPVAVTTKTSSGKSASYEEKLLANVAEREAKRKEEVAEANKKMRESKKKSGKKDLDKALLNLVNSGQVFTIENLNSEMERMSGQ